MKIREAIEYADKLAHNSYPRETKIAWLSQLDGHVHREIILTHRGVDPGTEDFVGYTAETPQDTVLLVPFPYDEMYRFYLEMKIDEANRESAHYNISALKFNTAYQTYMDRSNRTHVPIGTANGFYF